MNSFFDLNKLRPAHSENAGTVFLCCCIPRGKVMLTCDFDRAAYAGGDTGACVERGKRTWGCGFAYAGR